MSGTGAKLIGAEAVIKGLQRYQERIKAEAVKGLAEEAFRVQKNAMENLTESGAVHMGRLRSSIEVRSKASGKVWEIYTNVNYARAVEFGSRPHWVPKKVWKPGGALSDWTRKKLGKDVGYLVARKIAREGTPAKPYMTPAAEAERPLMTKDMAGKIRVVFR